MDAVDRKLTKHLEKYKTTKPVSPRLHTMTRMQAKLKADREAAKERRRQLSDTTMYAPAGSAKHDKPFNVYNSKKSVITPYVSSVYSS